MKYLPNGDAAIKVAIVAADAVDVLVREEGPVRDSWFMLCSV